MRMKNKRMKNQASLVLNRNVLKCESKMNMLSTFVKSYFIYFCWCGIIRRKQIVQGRVLKCIPLMNIQ